MPVVVGGRRAGQGQPRSLNAWLDPATGRVLDVAEFGSSLVGVLHASTEA